jgi:hypothetical protein
MVCDERCANHPAHPSMSEALESRFLASPRLAESGISARPRRLGCRRKEQSRENNIRAGVPPEPRSPQVELFGEEAADGLNCFLLLLLGQWQGHCAMRP